MQAHQLLQGCPAGEVVTVLSKGFFVILSVVPPVINDPDPWQLSSAEVHTQHLGLQVSHSCSTASLAFHSVRPSRTTWSSQHA